MPGKTRKFFFFCHWFSWLVFQVFLFFFSNPEIAGNTGEMQLESLEMREIGEQEESQVPVPEEKDTPMEEINDRPETTEDNVKDNMFHDLVFVQLSSKYQMVVRQREKFKQRTTELEEELRLCQSTLLKLRQNQKTIIRSAIRKAVAVAVEKTKKELEKVSVHCLLVHRTHTNVYLPFLRHLEIPGSHEEKSCCHYSRCRD